MVGSFAPEGTVNFETLAVQLMQKEKATKMQKLMKTFFMEPKIKRIEANSSEKTFYSSVLFSFFQALLQ